MALSKADISLEDAIDIRELKNIKLANQLLKMKRIKKQDREEKMKMQEQAMQAQMNAQSQQMAAQMAAQKIQLETQAKIQIKQAEVAFDIEKMKNEAQLKMELMAKEFEYEMQVSVSNQGIISERDREKEKNKDRRISQQNSEQSKLIEQKKNNLPPVNFESNEDSLDGFDFAEFDPR